MRREAFRGQRGVTLVEILVVTTVLTLLAAITLPVYQIIQQRERERRLGEILDNVRASLFGSQVTDEYHTYTEGYQIYTVRQIQAMAPTEASVSYAIKVGASAGLLLPLNPSAIENAVGTKVRIPTAPTGVDASVTVTINRRFLRRIPPHPFVGWYPNAHWEFEAATYTNTGGVSRFASGSFPQGDITSGQPCATGVRNIWSKGAGFLIDGRNSDER